jgi:hypothetical protein
MKRILRAKFSSRHRAQKHDCALTALAGELGPLHECAAKSLPVVGDCMNIDGETFCEQNVFLSLAPARSRFGLATMRKPQAQLASLGHSCSKSTQRHLIIVGNVKSTRRRVLGLCHMVAGRSLQQLILAVSFRKRR